MGRRLFPDNDAWSSEASRAANNATVAFMDLLAILEEDGPIDLKDFHFLITNTVGTFVTGLSVTRRLGDPAAPPNPVARAYPRLDSQVIYHDDEEDEGERRLNFHMPRPYLRGERGTQGGDIKWLCDFRGTTEHCIYNDEVDPMHDECVYCGEPQERK